MLLGRSYQYTAQCREKRQTHQKPETRLSSAAEPASLSPSGSGTRTFGWRPASYSDYMAAPARTSEQRKSKTGGSIDNIWQYEEYRARQGSPQAQSLNHSEPLSIPRPARTAKPVRTPQQIPRPAAGDESAKDARLKLGTRKVLPPHVVTFLASTTIPRKRNFARPRLLDSQRMSSEDLVEHWKQLDNEDDITADPNLEILLSPPQADDFFPQDIGYESLSNPSNTRSRSSSSESLPSLDADDNSPLSWPTPQTPESVRRGPSSVSSGKERSLSSPPSVECLSNHPLLDTAEDLLDESELVGPFSPYPDRSRHTRTFNAPTKEQTPATTTSALSISLKALRLAARSFSNFAAPSLVVLPEDHLSRGLFGSQGQHPAWPSEMRPKPSNGSPTAAMRRYLNPSHSTVPGDFHLHGASWDHIDLEAIANTSLPVIDENGFVHTTITPTVIKMQTYQGARTIGSRRGVNSASAGSRPLPIAKSKFSAYETTAEADVVTRVLVSQTNNKMRREPRENSDFLRVCVLEMQMRRAGKLESIGVGVVGSGRAKFWLPARVDVGEEKGEAETGTLGTRRVPKRWLPLAA